jgi:hypothetical protein
MQVITPRGKGPGEAGRGHAASVVCPRAARAMECRGSSVRDAQGSLLEWQAPSPWPVCASCDVLVGARDEPGLSRRIVLLLARRAGRLLSTTEAQHVAARHHAFFAALPGMGTQLSDPRVTARLTIREPFMGWQALPFPAVGADLDHCRARR